MNTQEMNDFLDVNPSSSEKTPQDNDDVKLHFISFNDPREMNSSSSIRAIRRHAMKEIGKQRRHRNRPVRLELMIDQQVMHSQNLTSVQKPSMSWWLGAGPMDPFIRYPMNLGTNERELVALSKC
jgi:hypothetical protein